MNKLLAAVAIAAALAAPASGQSFDPSVGSGNLGPQAEEDPALAAYARGVTERNDLTGRRVQPYTLQEHRALDRAKGYIW